MVLTKNLFRFESFSFFFPPTEAVRPSYVNLFMGKFELDHVDHDHTSPLLTFSSDIFMTCLLYLLALLKIEMDLS